MKKHWRDNSPVSKPLQRPCLLFFLLGKYIDTYNLPLKVHHIDYFLFAAGLLLSSATGMVSGLLAGWDVAKINPAEAMRSESPSVGSSTALEGFKGLWRRLPELWKMSWRSIMRNKIRFSITALGTASVVLLLILALFFNESKNFLLSQYFEYENTYTHLARMNTLIPIQETDRWLSWKGVKSIEPMLEIPVTIRSMTGGGRTERKRMF